MEELSGFLGVWHLIPEKCNYELGEPPLQGSYEIQREGDKLIFIMNWTDHQNKNNHVEFTETCDGLFHELEDKTFADEICLLLRDDGVLASQAKKDGKLTLSATRELVSETELKVSMFGVTPAGGGFRNVSFYIKERI